MRMGNLFVYSHVRVDGLQGYAVERPMPLEKMTQSALWAARAASDGSR